MSLILFLAGELAIFVYLVMWRYRYRFIPISFVADRLRNILLFAFFIAQIIFILGIVPLVFWPSVLIGSPELLLRSSLIVLLALYHFKNGGLAYLEMGLPQNMYDVGKRTIEVFTLFSTFIFGTLPIFIYPLLMMPSVHFYLFIIFLKLLFAPEIYSKFTKFRIRNLLALAYISLILVSGTILLSLSNYMQASHYNAKITVTNEPPFSSEVPANQLRLVDRDLAESIMLRYLAEFGSNARLGRAHIALNNTDLIWIAPVYPANLWAQNYIIGFIIVYASDPVRPPTIIKEKFYIGNELLGGRDIQISTYLTDTNIRRSLAYFAVHPTEGIKLVITKVHITPFIYGEPAKIIVYNSDGSIYGEYVWYEAPDWIPQLLDEDLLESIVSNWGNYRRGNNIDFFAPGFLWVPTSPDRVAISEDTRYIINPDNGKVEAYIHVHPVGNDRTLAGIFKVNTSGIYFHDFRGLQLISGLVSHDIAESNLPKPATGYYFATMGMLYPIHHPKTNEIVWTWFVPVYWQKEDTTVFAGLALINARDTSIFAFDTIREDEHGPDFVSRMISIYKDALIGKTYEGGVEITAKVLRKFTYVLDGTTHIVLQLNDTLVTYAEATPKTVNVEDWYELLSLESGSIVRLIVVKSGEKWIITSIDVIYP